MNEMLEANKRVVLDFFRTAFIERLRKRRYGSMRATTTGNITHSFRMARKVSSRKRTNGPGTNSTGSSNSNE